jgi:hypothetical protein
MPPFGSAWSVWHATENSPKPENPLFRLKNTWSFSQPAQ